MMIQAADLLATTKNPSEDQIRTAMNGHLCRCGTYPQDPDRDPAGGESNGKGRCVMTGLIPEKDVSRNSFIKGGGVIVVVSVAGAAGARKAANDPSAPSPAHTGAFPDRRTRPRSTPSSRSTRTTPSTLFPAGSSSGREPDRRAHDRGRGAAARSTRSPTAQSTRTCRPPAPQPEAPPRRRVWRDEHPWRRGRRADAAPGHGRDAARRPGRRASRSRTASSPATARRSIHLPDGREAVQLDDRGRNPTLTPGKLSS